MTKPTVGVRRRAALWRYLFAIAAGLAYGVALRLSLHYQTALAKQDPFYPTDLWVMSIGYLFLGPGALGWITAASVTTDDQFHWLNWIFLPWVPVLLSCVVLLLLNLEGAICLVFGVPITLACGSIGGILGGLSTRQRFGRKPGTIACVAIVPILVAGLEYRADAPMQTRTVETSILIHAPASTVWQNIERVPAIRTTEIHPSWTHRLGFPLPVEATLNHEGIGGVRDASFEHGLLFTETIDQWKPLDTIGFSIAADTAHIPPTTLDEHVTIGGRYFNVLHGEYHLEPRSNGDILLHLSSHERLSTDFNLYAALWSDAVMRDLQQGILEVVKHRCESPSSPTSATLNP